MGPYRDFYVFLPSSPLKLLWAQFFRLFSNNNGFKISNEPSNCAFRSPEEDKYIFGSFWDSEIFFFAQEQNFLLIFLKIRKKSYFTKLCMTMILLVIYVFYGSPATHR